MLHDTVKALSEMTKSLPIGTNLGLLHLLWMLVSGGLLVNRGALFGGLKSSGLSDAATRRAWAALRYGQWRIGELVEAWGKYVRQETSWVATTVEGYQAVAVDVTAIWRPTLKNCPSQHYHPSAQRALPAVIIGLAGEVGTLNGQRLAVPRRIERVHPRDGSEQRLWTDLLAQVRKGLGEKEVVVVDAGVKISQLHESRIDRYVVRLASNFSAGRNVLPDHTRGRKPVYGATVRPLARIYKGRTIPATTPDETTTWQLDGRLIQVHLWRALVLPKTSPHPTNTTFDVYAFHDPSFKHPWLLATSVSLAAQSVYALYTNRWPVEQLPLAAKQMLGAHRQFVHAPETIHRLPELALLAGSVLSVLAASTRPLPTGFWDRHPKPTPGRFRRALFGHPFPKDAPLPDPFRKKRSATAHLPKGNLARFPKSTPIHINPSPNPVSTVSRPPVFSGN